MATTRAFSISFARTPDVEQPAGANDRRKLDEYLTSIRDIELRIDKANDSKAAKTPPPDIKVPSSTPREFQEHVRSWPI